MTNPKAKILFLHGLDSSKDSTKYHTLDYEKKYCINVDYRNLSYQTVQQLYCQLIEKIKPNLLVGHSLGGYWALKMSRLFGLPAVISNPSLAPNFRDDYPKISDEDLNHDIPQMAYLELGDEILDMYQTQQQLESYMLVEAVEGGHHRLLKPEQVNHVIDVFTEHFKLFKE